MIFLKKPALLVAIICFLFTSLSFFPKSNAASKRADSNPTSYPQGYFTSPVGRGFVISGSFGELRPNHFHEGIDIISVTKRDGEGIYAAADGYISRIKTAPKGYGNIVYITHPNGYTTAYAHLIRFGGRLHEYLKNIQYQSQSFEQDINTDSLTFPVKQGELIGYMGNTGSSQGVHLHFEIRHTDTQAPTNPLLYGLPFQDSKAPTFKSIKIYALDAEGNELSSRWVDVVKSKTGEIQLASSPVVGSEYFGIGISANDGADASAKITGIYGASVSCGDSLAFKFQFNEFLHENTRYINAHSDNNETRKGRRMHRCFRLPGNKLEIYDDNANSGMIRFNGSGVQPVNVVIRDAYNNSTSLNFNVYRDTTVTQPKASPANVYNYILPWNEGSVIKSDVSEFRFSGDNFYETAYIYYNTTSENTNNIWSAMQHLGPAYLPIQKPFGVSLKPYDGMTPEAREKALLVVCDNDGDAAKVLGNQQWNGEFLTADAQQLGTFCIMTDYTPPTVSMLGKMPKTGPMKVGNTIRFKASDNLTELKNYYAVLNGSWAVLEYDKKSATLFHVFADYGTVLSQGTNTITVSVSDAVGNETTKSFEFTQ